ncbi:MAG TPA: glycoside hydrolase family 18 protein, partial [Armatimonadota bacterium]|nr:glycoside hydrolase family 18 protein [Armatimonadota bacterium]
SAGQDEDAMRETRPHVFMGYYGSWGGETMPPAGIDYSLFTHICHAFVHHTDDGALALQGNMPSSVLTGSAHDAGVRVLASAAHSFTALTSDSAATDLYISALIDLVREHDYDGVDLDWEHPGNANERDLHAAFIRRLRGELDDLGAETGKRYELTAAVIPNQWLDVSAMAETMDFVNVMCYDMSGNWPSATAGQNAPLFPTSKDPGRASTAGHMQWWVDRGMPREKLVVGFPLYGWIFTNFEVGERVGDVQAPKHAGSLAYSGLAGLLEQGWEREADEEGRVPCYWSADRTRFMGIDDPESMGEKSKWARDEGFAGVFFWQIGHDRMEDDSHPLIEAAAAQWPSPRAE